MTRLYCVRGGDNAEDVFVSKRESVIYLRDSRQEITYLPGGDAPIWIPEECAIDSWGLWDLDDLRKQKIDTFCYIGFKAMTGISLRAGEYCVIDVKHIKP